MAEKDDLIYLARDPLNAEVRLERIRGLITPAGQHYVRDHFPIPGPPAHLEVGGDLPDVGLRAPGLALRRDVGFSPRSDRNHLFLEMVTRHDPRRDIGALGAAKD